MTIVYKSHWRSSKAVRLLALTVLLVLACAAWLGLDGQMPDAFQALPAPAHVWGSKDGAPAEATGESPFASGANGVLPGGLTGIWVGTINMGAGKPLQFSFDMRETGGALSGTASFPIGDARIDDGKVVGNLISFATQHKLPSTGQVLITRFSGELSAGMLHLTMLSEGVESHLTLKPFPG